MRLRRSISPPTPKLRFRRGCLLASVTIFAYFGATGTSQAQQRVLQLPGMPPAVVQSGQPSGEDENFDSSVFQPPERELLRHLDAGRKFLSEGRFSEAVQHLGKILEHPRDYFYNISGNNTSFAGIKKYTLDLIGEMAKTTDGGREAYELQFGTTAKRLLENALQEGNFSEILNISRRYFHTQAGYEATYLVGVALFDRGEPLAAALKFRELQAWPQAWKSLEPGLSLAEACCWLQCGDRAEASEVLKELLRRNPECLQTQRPSGILSQESPETPRNLEELLARLEAELPEAAAFRTANLDNWLMPGGNPSRNGEADGGVPLLRRIWSIPHTDKPLVAACLEWADQECRRSKVPVLPSLQPIVVGNRVFMRNIDTLTAVDFKSGKRLWEAPVDSTPSSGDAKLSIPQRAQNAANASLRMWLDRTYGTVSSDGTHVFAIEDLVVDPTPGLPQVGQRLAVFPAMGMAGRIRPFGQAQTTSDANRLVAYDAETGKIAWHVGGTEEPLHLPLAGTFFLGPPVPCDNRIYVLGEREGEILVFALKAATGELLWQQPLVTVGVEGGYGLLRKMAGLSPSTADGILICPTNAGAVVAVDASTHALRWGYLYSQANDPRRYMHLNAAHIMRVRMHNQLAWTDPNPVIADKRVLITPPDSNEIHCIDLVDGTLRWKVPSEGEFFIAAVSEGNVLLVGMNGFRALRLEDGKPAWNGKTLPLPAGSVAAGRGFISNGRYVLPLTCGAVFCFDAATGENPETVFSPTGALPGNLICHNGRVLSQTPTGLTLYYQRDFLQDYLAKALKDRPDHPTLLTLQGEMAVAGRDYAGAIESFRRAYKTLPSEANRDRLWRVIYDRLASDSDAAAALWHEADELSTTSSRKVAMMRLRARRARDSGDLAAAIPVYLDLLSMRPPGGSMVRVDPSRSLCIDRVVKYDIAEFREAKPQVYNQQIAPLVADYVEDAFQSGDRRTLESLLCCFGQIPQARNLEDRLLKLYREEGDLIRAEDILLRRIDSKDPKLAAAATAELAVLLHAVERYDDAAVCYRDLAVKWTDVPCRDGKTGLQLVKAIPANDPVWRSIRSDLAWPAGEIRVSKSTGVNPSANTLAQNVRLVGSALPFAQFKDFRFDYRSLELQERDGFGRVKWKLSLGEVDRQRPVHGRLSSDLSIVGHRAYIVVNNVLFAIDMFDPDAPRILWRRPLFGRLSQTATADEKSSPNDALSILGRSGLAPLQNAFGIGVAVRPDYFVAGRDQVAFRQDSTHAAADPFSGDLLWTNASEPTSGHFFGNNEILFALDSNPRTPVRRDPQAAMQREPAETLSALDGRSLPAKMVPSKSEIVVYMGDRALTKRVDGTHLNVGVYDIVEGRYRTPPRLYDMRSRVTNLGRSVAGILEPNGIFHLISLDDGRVMASENLKTDSSFRSFILFEDKFGYYVIPISSKRTSRTVMRSNIPGCRSQTILTGYIYAFNREGKRRWAEPVKIENECFVVDQPANLPVLVLASNSTNRQNRRTVFSSILKCVDKRTGMVVCAEEFPNRSQRLDIVADPLKRTVRIDLCPNSVTLSYTGSGEMKAVAEKRTVDKAPTLSALRRSLLYGLEIATDDAADSYGAALDNWIPVMLPMYGLSW